MTNDIEHNKRLRVIPNEAVDWDDRKELLDVFYEATEGKVTLLGEMDHISSALLAVARWGARQAVEIMDDERG